MDHSCVNCLKILMIVLNFLCWLCGAFVVAFGIFQGMHSRFASLITTFWSIYPANTLVVTGTIVTCVCYLGVLGAIKENRCMLISIDTYFESDLMQSLQVYKQSGPEENQIIKDDFDSVQHLFRCCGVRGEADWLGNAPISCCSQDPCTPTLHANWQEGCLYKLRDWFAGNYHSTGAGVVTMFIIQTVLHQKPTSACKGYHHMGSGTLQKTTVSNYSSSLHL
ncbi:leukocyte surface antigen CD53-like isoform X4 [Entelurus aequoreus]|uniref:leukocyte surface antigen CD53-like isoform X4 n=1 Tax=Entelurus aequoreus TaxID=161455 RepID=UPI002B1D4C17|nr:leukocyte surface antigen CD53-like isoform X4 [Entelurus aequoreus]